MVDAESYVVQERELQRRLPHVPLEIIKHFLSLNHGNLDICYEQLRTQTPQVMSPNMEPFFHEFGRTSTISTSRPTEYQQRPLPYQYTPQSPALDNRLFNHQIAWDPSARSHTLPSRHRPHGHTLVHHDSGSSGGGGNMDPHNMYSHTLDRRHAGHGATSSHMYTQDSRQYNTVQGGATPSMYVQERQHYHDESQRTSYEQWQSSDWTTASNQVSSVIAVSRIHAQRQQLEALHKFQESLVQRLSYLKQVVDEKQHKLSRLRLEVSASQNNKQQVTELKEVIQTLEIDIREARNELQVHTVQSQMKQEEDLNTDEGVRWYCKECSFLNHPLMTVCEKCDIPKLRIN